MVTIRGVAAAMVAGVMVLAGAACSSGNDDAGIAELRGEVAGQFQSVLSVDDEQADCLAGEMIGIYGPEEMQQFVDDPDTYAPAEEASPEVTQKALEDCGISPMELVRDGNIEADGSIERDSNIEADGNIEADYGRMPTQGTSQP